MTITTTPTRLGEACRLTPILAEMREYDNIPPPKRAWIDLADRIEKAVIEDLIDASTTCYMTLYKPVVDMREAQKEYFKTRSADALARAKKLEREVDAILVRMLAVDEPEQGELPL